MYLHLKNKDIGKVPNKFTQSVVNRLDIKKNDWYLQSARQRMQMAEWELMYHGITLQAIDKRFKLYLKDRNTGELESIDTLDNKVINKARGISRLDPVSFEEETDQCSITTLELEEGIPTTSLIISELASLYINGIMEKERVVDLDNPTDKETEFALQRLLSVYGTSAKATLEIQQVVKDFIIKGRGYFRATMDMEKTNLIDALDVDTLILPPNHTDIESISGYYIIHTLSQDEVRVRFPALIDIVLNKEEALDYPAVSSFGDIVDGIYTPTKKVYDNIIANKVTNKTLNKEGRPPYEVSMEKYLQELEREDVSYSHSGTVWKLGRALRNMYEDYDISRFRKTVIDAGLDTYKNKKNKDYVRTNLLANNFKEVFGLKTDYFNNESFCESHLVEIVEFVDLARGRIFFYHHNHLLYETSIKDKVEAYKLCEVCWTSTTMSGSNKGGGSGLTSLVGGFARDFKDLIYALEIKANIESYGTGKVLINSAYLDASARDLLKCKDPVVMTTGNRSLSDMVGSNATGAQLPLVTPIDFTPTNSQYYLQLPTLLEQNMRARVSKVEQLNYQITKEQAAVSLDNRDTNLDMSVKDFFVQVGNIYPYLAINHILYMYDNTVYLPQIDSSVREVTGTDVKIPSIAKFVDRSLLTGVAKSKNIPKTIIFEQSALIIGKDEIALDGFRKAIAEVNREKEAEVVRNAENIVMTSPEFVAQATAYKDEVLKGQELARVQDTGMEEDVATAQLIESQGGSLEMEKDEAYGIDVTPKKKIYKAKDGEEPKSNNRLIDGDMAKKAVSEVFNAMLQDELDKKNYTTIEDKNIYISRERVQLAMLNGIFTIKPPKTKTQKMKEYEQMITLANNLGGSTVINTDYVLNDIFSLAGMNKEILLSPERQKENAAIKNSANISLNGTFLPEQIPAVAEYAYKMKVPMPKPPVQEKPPVEQMPPQPTEVG